MFSILVENLDLMLCYANGSEMAIPHALQFGQHLDEVITVHRVLV